MKILKKRIQEGAENEDSESDSDKSIPGPNAGDCCLSSLLEYIPLVHGYCFTDFSKKSKVSQIPALSLQLSINTTSMFKFTNHEAKLYSNSLQGSKTTAVNLGWLSLLSFQLNSSAISPAIV
jgi:hypothetical protein